MYVFKFATLENINENKTIIRAYEHAHVIARVPYPDFDITHSSEALDQYC